MTEAFSPADWYEIPGRGWVAVIAGIADYNPTELVGSEVVLSGATYVVRGVETLAIPDPTGKTFGLLVSAL